MNGVPPWHDAQGPETFARCQTIVKQHDLDHLAAFQTTVTETLSVGDTQRWNITTDRGDTMRDKFVVCANSTLAEQRIDGMERSQGDSFRTSHGDHGLTDRNLEQPGNVRVGIIGTGEGTVQIIPPLGEHAESLHDFHRTHLSIDVPDDRQIGHEWAAKLDNGWQSQHQAKIMSKIREQADRYGQLHHGLNREQEVRRQENNDLDQMRRIHKLIDNRANDQTTADA